LLRLIPIRKGVAKRNLEIILPDATDGERAKILRGTYDNIVQVGVEFAILQNNPKLSLEWVEAEDTKSLDNSPGGILLACHVGNWELAACWAAQSGYKISSILRESSDLGEREIMADMRAKFGVKCIPTTAPMTKALGVLKRNEFLAIAPDQHGGGDGTAIPLFGLETKMPRGPAVFAYLTKKPIIPVYIRRVAPFRHKLRCGPPLAWEEKENRDETILGIMKTINAERARIILEAPDQWLAQHRRFREHY
jgi:KDO2-lipid IV(A) lauroyltransferase